MNITIALITPPMGACLFVASTVSKTELSAVFKEIVPFILYALLALTLVIAFPKLVLFIPGVFN